jgi:chromosomal replication initiator protein
MFVYNANANEDQSQALWQACLVGLQANLPQTQINLWLRAIEPLSLIQTVSANNTQILLTCQTKQSQKINAIMSQFQAIVERQCHQLCGHAVEWSLLAAATDSFSTAIQGSLLEANPPTAELDSTSETKHTPTLKSLNSSTNTNSNENPFESSTHEGTGLNSRLSFEHFVVGKANQMAHAAAQHVAHNPGVSYNPFFLYGGVGLGKTHLVHAVGNTVLANNPNARIRYIHANQFIADVVGSYRRQTFDSFKRYYHGLDVLLIDDIQFFADKKRTQEELFYAFETLVANRSQIILTSDTFPKDLEDIENRLVSRFSAGLIAAIDPPELEMRVAILQEKAKSLSITLQEDVAFYIAKNLRSNIRELEGALHKLLAYSRFQNSHITLEMAKTSLRDVISGPRSILSVETIQKVVADYYKVKLADLCGKRRLASIVLPRQVAMYLIKELTQKSLPDIGEAFGGRDHTTVLHAVRKIALEKTNNPQLSHQIHVIQQTLGG